MSSVVHADELVSLRLEWATAIPRQFDDLAASLVALQLTVTTVGDDDWFQEEIWRPDWYPSWEYALGQLADALQDWVCETRFAWGQQRRAKIPD